MDEPTGQRVQTWLKPGFAQELKELADADGRSVSGLIRPYLNLQLALGGGEATVRGGGMGSASSAPAARAGHKEE